MTLLREEVQVQDQWDLTVLYEDLAAWEKEFDQAIESKTFPHWPSLLHFRGKLGESEEMLLEAVKRIQDTHRLVNKLYTYAHLKHDENLSDEKYKNAYMRIMTVYQQLGQEISWFEPELIALDQNILDRYLKSEKLSEFHHFLKLMIRLKPYTLTQREEELLALASPALQTPHQTFSALSDTDFEFKDVKNETGEKVPLTHANYSLYIRGFDRTLRENCFLTYHDKYEDHQNTLAELLGGVVQKHFFNARARKYPTCVDAALYPNEIPSSVYHTLIKATHQHIPSLHRYLRLRKKQLKLDELRLYDLYVPLTSEFDRTYTFEEAIDLVVDSVAPLGEAYQSTLRKGLTSEAWTDRYENQNKRSGAYSSGCYDSHPYILMNFKGTIRDVFTLAHEAGHSMHSHYSRKNQPYHYSDYTIFVAEVASTFNESLLMKKLLKEASSKEEKIFLLNQELEDIRATFFRQVAFAEFELKIHTLAEQFEPLTPARLKQEYEALTRQYFGDTVTYDEEGFYEWARIPHFYYNFYVYQYATGLSAAYALSEKVLVEGQPAVDKYLHFLSSGSSAPPIDLLRNAGVDMETEEPIHQLAKRFDETLSELETLLD